MTEHILPFNKKNLVTPAMFNTAVYLKFNITIFGGKECDYSPRLKSNGESFTFQFHLLATKKICHSPKACIAKPNS